MISVHGTKFLAVRNTEKEIEEVKKKVCISVKDVCAVFYFKVTETPFS